MARMSSSLTYALFDSALGECALAWSDAGVARVWLPEALPGRLRVRLSRDATMGSEAQPAGEIASAIGDIQALLRGVRVDLGAVRIDDSRIDAFDRGVYAAARLIPAGRVVTYAVLAERIGAGALAARAVGQSLGRNPFPIVVPCHRIVAARGDLGGFSAPGGAATKRRLLAIEDARLDDGSDLFDATPMAPVPGA